MNQHMVAIKAAEDATADTCGAERGRVVRETEAFDLAGGQVSMSGDRP
jgi:hypothetical protein